MATFPCMAGSNESTDHIAAIEVCGVRATYRTRDAELGLRLWRGKRGATEASVVYREGATHDGWYVRVRDAETGGTWATADTLSEAVERASLGYDGERLGVWR